MKCVGASLLGAALLAAPRQAQGSVWIVDETLAAPADFATIQEAVDAAAVSGPGLVPLAGTAHELEISSPGFEGGTVSLRLSGVPGEFAYALASPVSAPGLFLAWNGSLAVSPTSTVLFLGRPRRHGHAAGRRQRGRARAGHRRRQARTPGALRASRGGGLRGEPY